MDLDFKIPNHRTLSWIDSFFQEKNDKQFERNISLFYPYDGTDLGWESVEQDDQITFNQAWWYALGYMRQSGITEEDITKFSKGDY